MEVEHVAFYPHEIKNPKCFNGSLHVYLVDFNLDLKGIFCCVQGKNVFVDLPHRMGTDDEGNKVKYPLISFCDAKKHRDLIMQIKKGLMEFLMEEMKG